MSINSEWSWAIISDPPDYRYSLGRRLRSESKGDSNVLFIMLNPSTADHWKNDPTIKRCIGFADSWGYRVLTVANLFAFRTAYPDEMLEARSKQQNIVGPENDQMILELAMASDCIICAWGNGGTIESRDKEVIQMLLAKGHKLHSLGITKKGQPKHPLYIKGNKVPELWMWEELP